MEPVFGVCVSWFIFYYHHLAQVVLRQWPWNEFAKQTIKIQMNIQRTRGLSQRFCPTTFHIWSRVEVEVKNDRWGSIHCYSIGFKWHRKWRQTMPSKHKSKLLIGSIINASLRLEISRAQQQ
jgi:hypothetical protein